ncbi:acyl carrier protein [Streptomyces sp. RKAG290]|uniref:acyl carrier protein n=1 Tax=Streptomyces sp. RKAG290 TaxID=2888348 RepID=UPI002033F640|nr:acyl carrier protein [Streptomyces sp. RKAG290]MCM2414293.1 acyl carrier protein [Streptomyces sp. RKAG290]
MTANRFTMDDLRRILREGAGEEAGLDGDIDSVTFQELGYDSLALLETGVRIGREFGLELEDDHLIDAETPRQLVDAVNELLVAVRAA